MKSILFIAKYTLIQQVRNRLYLVVLLFGAVLTASSLLFGALAADEEIRVILNIGLMTAELFGLIAACFCAVVLVLEEMESRTIYLILSRPFPRYCYILGRFLGLCMAVIATMLLMIALIFAVLHFKGWQVDPLVLWSVPFMFLKIAVIASLALLLSLFSSSSVLSVVLTFFLWVLGHFGRELKFMAEKSQNVAVSYGIEAVFIVAPNLQLLNVRDYFHSPSLSVQQGAWAAGYALLYCAAALALSIVLFQKKEM